MVVIAQAVSGLLLLPGSATAWVATGLIPILIGALWTYARNEWVFSNVGGGREYPLVSDHRQCRGRRARARGSRRRAAFAGVNASPATGRQF